MLTKESLVTRLYVKEARNMFEDICNERESPKMDPRVFTILNYEKMVGDLAEYISGYIKYKEKGSNKYKGQVAGTTLQFYNRMFTDEKKYRRKFYLPDMKDIVKGFLEQTKKLQDILDAHPAGNEAQGSHPIRHVPHSTPLQSAGHIRNHQAKHSGEHSLPEYPQYNNPAPLYQVSLYQVSLY